MNKVKFSIIFLVAALCTGLSAQAKFGFGPKIGLNVNQLHFSGSELLDASNRCGFTAGLTAEYMAPIIGIGVDLSVMYTHMKTHVDFEYVDPAANYVSGMNASGNFLEIPLHLKYKFNLPAVASIIKPYVFTGPSVAVKLSGDNSYFSTKTTQWGWDLGLGVELINHLQIGAGYTWGLNKLMNVTKMDSELDVITSDEIKVKNNYWTVTAAWMF